MVLVQHRQKLGSMGSVRVAADLGFGCTFAEAAWGQRGVFARFLSSYRKRLTQNVLKKREKQADRKAGKVSSYT